MITKSKFFASAIAVSIFVMHIVYCEQFLNPPCIARAAAAIISPLIKM